MKNHTAYLEIRMLVAIVAKTAVRALEQRLWLTDTGVSGLQFMVLRALGIEAHTISELSQHFMLDPSTLVPVIDALERKGLARRGRDPSDRRRIPISLTELGTELVSGFPMVAENDPLSTGLNAMGDERCRQLLELLRELVSHMPEGADILQKVSSRLHVHAAFEQRVRSEQIS